MDIVYAKATAEVITPDGTRVIVHGGTHWLAEDPAVRARPDLFTPDARYGLAWSGGMPSVLNDPPVETASAAPGERRNVRRG